MKVFILTHTLTIDSEGNDEITEIVAVYSCKEDAETEKAKYVTPIDRWSVDEFDVIEKI